MTNRDVALLAFKLLGLWLIANAAVNVAGIPYLWEPQFESVREMTVFATLLPALVAIGIGVPLWVSADWFAGRIFPGERQDRVDLDRLRGEPVFALALSILGVLFVCESLPTLVNGIVLFTQSRFTGSTILGPDVERQELLWSSAAKANVTAGAARLLIGLALLAGPARLSAAAARVRKELAGPLADEARAEREGQDAEQREAAGRTRDE